MRLDKDNDYTESNFVKSFDTLQRIAYNTSIEKGFHDNKEYENDGYKLMLMITELTEAFECIRKGKHNEPSEHIPLYSALEEELADVIIRIMDYAEWRGLNVAIALVEKMKFNQTRPLMHGGKKF